MFDIDLVPLCGDILALSLEEALGPGSIAVIGPRATEMKFLDWRPRKFENPKQLEGVAEYDYIVCVQCLSQLRGVKLINIDDRLFAVQGTQLVDLSKDQARQASAFMKRAGLSIPRGTSAVLPLELHDFLGSAEKALTADGKLVFIDSGPAGLLDNLSIMKAKYEPLPRFLANTNAGKLHVVNSEPLLAGSPHPIRDSAVHEIVEHHGFGRKVIPWLELKEKLSHDEEAVLEPFITRAASVFADWGELVRDYKTAANSMKELLQDSEGLTELYSTLFAAEGEPGTDFTEKAWARTNEILSLPPHPDFFAATLTKGI